MQIENKESLILSFERLNAMCLIILCHLASALNWDVLGQIFNVGIYVFFILSGYLYSFKEISNPITWLKRRMLKLLIPCYVYYVISTLLLLLLGKLGQINVLKVIQIILNLQGLCGGGIGNVVTGHLWFLSYIMICYLITPILQWIKLLKKCLYKIVFLLFLIILGITASFNCGGFYAHTAGIVAYTIIYFWGKNLLHTESKIKYVMSSIFMILAVVLRVYTLTLTVNPKIEILYTSLIVPYTHLTLGWWIFLTVYLVSDKMFLFLTKTTKIIKFLGNLSFEIYITHYMFLVGVLGRLSKNVAMNLMIFLLGTTGYSLVLFGLKKFFEKTIKEKEGYKNKC